MQELTERSMSGCASGCIVSSRAANVSSLQTQESVIGATYCVFPKY